MRPEDIEEPEDIDKENLDAEKDSDTAEGHSNYKTPNKGKDDILHLSGMFQNWFLDYASYVILERAVPHMADGLKPVQRRILHSMKRMDDGRYNKVANIIGHTMQFHPHGDASIGDALVQLGQKDLLVDCQGNWGNIFTGDGAAAPRYIEARLTKFALEVLFNPKTTEWRPSYDGRNKEPIALPVKYPLLLAQGAEGIAVGLSSKILPHNFNEICDASIAHLEGKEYNLYPDFQTGGYVDVERYNDGARGGSVKIRAKITKLDNRTLIIKDIPFGKTSSSVVDSILRANERGKIKIRKVDDITAQDIEIHVHLPAGVSSDIMIDALYAFTDCEISISPNCCVVEDNKPHFLSVSDVLVSITNNTLHLLRTELEIEKAELEESLHFSSLEKIFIRERIYKDKEFENAKNMDEAVKHIFSRLEKFKKDFFREVTRDDVLKLMEIRMVRILRFSSDKAEDLIAKYKEQIEEINHNIETIVDYTISWYIMLKEKYGKNFPRKTEIRSFDTIEATKVVEANEKLYINREEGFVGTTLRNDEYICNCSMLDDIIVVYKDGRYKIVKVSEKMFLGKDVLYVNVFQRNDERTIYNLVYRQGKKGPFYIKRCAIMGVTREKEYDLSQGIEGTKLVYFTANPNGEAETIRVLLKPKPRQRIFAFEKDFSEIDIRGRDTMGNILTKSEVHKISLKQKGGSTLGGRKVWFDKDVLRLNYDERGLFLGEFHNEDEILVVNKNGDFYTTNFDLSNHFDKDFARVEKFDSEKAYTAVLFDADQEYMYVKRFMFESSARKLNFLGENAKSTLSILTDIAYPRFEVKFGGDDKNRALLEIDAEEFIGVKSYRARGKRLTTYQVDSIKELKPIRFPEIKKEKPRPKPQDDDEINEEDIITIGIAKQTSFLDEEKTNEDSDNKKKK